ncbi:MAG: REP-associated tyrosine transposase [bacterium]
MEFKKYPHNPPHLFIDGAIYFITGGVLDKRLILYDDEHKEIVRATMEKWFAHFQWHLDAWIILGNHYHLMAKAKLANDMPTIIGRMHGGSATLLNRLDGTPARQVWWNYWDTCIRGDYDFETRLAYIYWNAVKHGVVARPQDYLWSGFSRAGKQEDDQCKFGEKPPGNLELQDNFDDF